LETKGLLGTCFTQNIDTLERRAGVSKEKLVEAHGSFASQRCIDCKTPFDTAEIKRLIQEEKIPRCSRCRGLVKPDIVFFGEAVSVLLPFAPSSVCSVILSLHSRLGLSAFSYLRYWDLAPSSTLRIVDVFRPTFMSTGVDQPRGGGGPRDSSR